MADRTQIEQIEEQAALFALGALPPEEAERFGRRLAAECPLCRAEVNGCAPALAALALSVPELAPPPSARARLLQSLDGKRAVSKPMMGVGTLVRADNTDWQKSPIPGVQVRNLYEQKTLLVRMAPKTSYPAHEHPEAEQCLVLEGSITSDGVTAYAGDFTYMPAGSSHHPLYSENGCLLLIAYT
jgi:mannose-6-phosphate isomerase-like protein (cupin superfamily)